MTGRIFEIKKSPGFFLTLNSAPIPNLAPFDILKEFPCVENTNKKIAKFKWKGQPFYSRLQGSCQYSNTNQWVEGVQRRVEARQSFDLTLTLCVI
jgi:hypothetical protein